MNEDEILLDLEWILESMTDVLIRGREDHMKMEAETGFMHLIAYAKTLFPRKVTFIGTGGWDLDTAF